MSASPTVDVNVPRFTRSAVAAVIAAAFLLRWPVLVVALFGVLAVSTVGGPSVAPIGLLYTGLIRPWLHPDGPEEYEPAGPPRFAQTLATVVLGVATVAFAAGWPALGWGSALLVAVAEGVAAITGICAGCRLYDLLAER
jgi:hypothetical protein